MRHSRWLQMTIGVWVALLATMLAIDFAMQRLDSIRSGVYEPRLERKICTLITHAESKPELIVAGDSRAERQVIPAQLGEALGVKAVNIAFTASDLPLTFSALVRHAVLENQPTLVISTTFFQVNDGALDNDSISAPMMFRIDWIDQFKLFRSSLPELVYRKWGIYVAWLKGNEPCKSKVVPEGGFYGVQGQLGAIAEVDLNRYELAHPWYRDLSFPGIKWKAFCSALSDLASTGATVVLYNPPAAPLWPRHTQGGTIDRAERAFTHGLQQEATRYPNVHVIDFYGDPPALLTDEHYYDIQHVNRQGAAIFTDELARRLIAMGIQQR